MTDNVGSSKMVNDSVVNPLRNARQFSEANDLELQREKKSSSKRDHDEKNES